MCEIICKISETYGALPLNTKSELQFQTLCTFKLSSPAGL